MNFPPTIKSEHEDISFPKFDVDTNLATLHIATLDDDHWGGVFKNRCSKCNDRVHVMEEDKFNPGSSYLVVQRPQKQHVEPSYWSAGNHDSDTDWPNRNEESPGLPHNLSRFSGIFIPEHDDLTDDEEGTGSNLSVDDCTDAGCNHVVCRRLKTKRVVRPERVCRPRLEYSSYYPLTNLFGRTPEEAIADSVLGSNLDINPQNNVGYYSSQEQNSQESSPTGSEISLHDSISNGSTGLPGSPYIGISVPSSPNPMPEDLPITQIYHGISESPQLSEMTAPQGSMLFSITPVSVHGKSMIGSDTLIQGEEQASDSPPDSCGGYSIDSTTASSKPLLNSSARTLDRNGKTPLITSQNCKIGVKRQTPRLKERRTAITSSPRNMGVASLDLESESNELQDGGNSQVVSHRKPISSGRLTTVLRTRDSDNGCTATTTSVLNTASSSTRRKGKKPGSRKTTPPGGHVYKCELCPKTFTRRNDVKRHMRNASIHKGVIPSNFNSDTRCGRCGEELSRPDARRRHEAKKPVEKELYHDQQDIFAQSVHHLLQLGCSTTEWISS